MSRPVGMEVVLTSRNYLLKQPAGPPRAKVLLDQTIIPALIDAAAAIETPFGRIAACARRAPMFGLAVAFGIGWVASRVVRPSR